MAIHKGMAGLSRREIGSVALYFYRLADAGGAERMICQLANELAARGFRVHLVSWDQPEARAFYPLHPDVMWDKLGFQSGILDKLRRTRALAQVLGSNDVRVLLGFVMSGDRTVYAAAKLARVRLIAAERNAPAMYRLRYSSFQRWLSFRFLHLADRITVQMPEFIAGYPDSLHDRMEVIPNPVPVVSRHARPATANAAARFTLLAVSRLDGVQKRVDRLVGAFSRVAGRHPAWDLRIVGDGRGGEQGDLRRLAAERGVTDRVHFEPSTADIFDAYLKAHLFAIPSLWEGFPNALAEAMSHGLPAVGFEKAAGVAELIRGGGWLAQGLDDESTLADALDRAMADDAERAHRGKLASQSMTAFAPEAQFDRWAALLDSMLTDKPR